MFRNTNSAFPTSTISTEEYVIPLARSEAWIEEAAEEGELAVDVYESGDHFVVQSTIAGVQLEDLSLSLHRDLLTIRGRRSANAPDDDRVYLAQECYWGPFSRSILFPEPVDVPRSSASIKQGMLTIILPKAIEQTEIGITSADH